MSRAATIARSSPSPVRETERHALDLGASHLMVGGLSLVTLALMSLIFAPISAWPVAFVCLVPWMVASSGSRTALRVYVWSYLWAAVFFLFNMRWLYPATGAGYVALSLYLAAYFPVLAATIRHAARRRRWPLALAFPIAWVGSEMIRAVLFTGFPWFFLSHSLAPVKVLIQTSDLVGAYGVSFMVAAVNGAIADLVLSKWARRRDPALSASGSPRTRVSVGIAAMVVAGTVVYGAIQLARNTTSAGPRVAIVQGDFISTVFPERAVAHDRATDAQKLDYYLDMMQAASERKPDLTLLPETPWIMFLNPEERDFHRLSRLSFSVIQDYADTTGSYVVTGSATRFRTPNDLLAKEREHNSATIFSPNGKQIGRYDKVHLVPFGEYVPFRFGRLRFLYFWLNQLMPFSGPDGNDEYSMFPGEGFHTYEMRAATQGGKVFRFAIPICYEDVMPYVARRFVRGDDGRKKVDFLLNISNDGWFGRGIQQPQHLAIAVFRAVENRVGIARAVNTGVSAFIDPIGRVYDRVKPGANPRWPGACGVSVAEVVTDSRFTWYTRWGDWFAWTCAVVWGAILIDNWFVRPQRSKEQVAT